MNRIKCQTMTPVTRGKYIKDWILALLGFPMAYIMLPVSCCVRNPAAHVLNDDPDTNPVLENLAVGCFGGIACIACCGCFCGHCGTYGPKEF